MSRLEQARHHPCLLVVTAGLARFAVGSSTRCH
jgi:hypothetical protein